MGTKKTQRFKGIFLLRQLNESGEREREREREREKKTPHLTFHSIINSLDSLRGRGRGRGRADLVAAKIKRPKDASTTRIIIIIIINNNNVDIGERRVVVVVVFDFDETKETPSRVSPSLARRSASHPPPVRLRHRLLRDQRNEIAKGSEKGRGESWKSQNRRASTLAVSERWQTRGDRGDSHDDDDEW